MPFISSKKFSSSLTLRGKLREKSRVGESSRKICTLKLPLFRKTESHFLSQLCTRDTACIGDCWYYVNIPYKLRSHSWPKANEQLPPFSSLSYFHTLEYTFYIFGYFFIIYMFACWCGLPGDHCYLTKSYDFELADHTCPSWINLHF